MCFVDDLLWEGNTKSETIINKLKQIFRIGAENKQIFEHISINLQQKSDFSLTISQKDYIDSISSYFNPKRLQKFKT